MEVDLLVVMEVLGLHQVLVAQALTTLVVVVVDTLLL
jgi:hypothetical protein